MELFVTSKENSGWVEFFCSQVVNIHVVSREESTDQTSKQQEAISSNRSYLMGVYDIKQFFFIMKQLCDQFLKKKMEFQYFIDVEKTRL